jgi:hypothetical protein
MLIIIVIENMQRKANKSILLSNNLNVLSFEGIFCLKSGDEWLDLQI